MLSQTYMSFSYVPRPVQPQGWARFAKDPVCGAKTEIYSAVTSVVYRGVTYYFCSEACHARFTREPGKYHQSLKSVSS
jgi:YHS domain-containing protein